MPKIDPAALPIKKAGSDYPAPYDAPCAGRTIRDLAAAGGASDWAANHCTIPPGGWSSQRHWHVGEDELVVVLAGEGVLIDDDGRTTMRAGDVAVFPKGDGNGHHLVNDGTTDLLLLALSVPETQRCHYPDIDLIWDPARGDLHRDGTPY
ncbi:MAG: cupin domain-containing protein [Sphingomonas taxi]